ncbi:hypothetical protein EC912_11159 [Luteibacter rhizovicinus]|uniref:ABC-type transport auxiliary lipoprotein component domain-containing protein n=1 Tax=Luteibacter rhizovicinus TaxID=242606 RepID=A0A4R3YGZ2_9GAMM|nr:PqiC family protein [Luteibacter rhizovicinus]TCV91466.1 hypothetical protein EC912_11159 [Luteibacter rhizovicinus]
MKYSIRALAWPTLLAVTLAGCATTAPMHFHTLVPQASGAATANAASFLIDVQPVDIPPQVDQPQLILRQGASDVVMLDGERWASPLADEVRGALSADLSSMLGTHDVNGLPRGAGQSIVRIKLDVRRFDSELGGQATLEAAWTVRGKTSAACASRVSEPAGSSYSDLVQAHQRALAQVAGQIAQVARAVGSGQDGRCP